MHIIYTVCNQSSLAHALQLADSISQNEPGPVFYICYVGDPLTEQLPVNARIVYFTELKIPDLETVVLRYYDFELLAAVRPWAATYLLEQNENCELLTFLAPTVRLLASYKSILSEDFDFFLTPNILEPLAPSSLLDDKKILNIGMFHSGSWILRNSEATRRTLSWWADRTVDRGQFDLCNGKNMDQLWLNYVPTWIPNTKFIDHNGWHYGLHAVLNRQLSRNIGAYSVENAPLISIDFAGLTFFDPVWSDHSGLIRKNDVLMALFQEYEHNLQKYEAYVPATGKQYGMVPDIKKYRVLRNDLAARLKSVTNYIDQF